MMKADSMHTRFGVLGFTSIPWQRGAYDDPNRSNIFVDGLGPDKVKNSFVNDY